MHREQLTLAELRERHARHGRTANKSEKTMAWYAGALADFCRYVEGPGGGAAPARLGDFTLERVRDYVLHLRGRAGFADHPYREARAEGLSDASINCYVRALRAFSSWLYEQEYTDVNVLGRLTPPRVTEHAVEILTEAEIRLVLAALSTPTATNVRNRAIFLTLLDTGIRASELLTLTLPRARLDDGYLLVLGKGRKERPVNLGATAAAAMRTYLLRYRPQPARADVQQVFLSEGYRVRLRRGASEDDATDAGDAQPAQRRVEEEEEELLFNEPGWPLSKNALDNLFLRLGRRAGMPRLHPHLLRHTYACRFLLAHRDLVALKTMLGHTTLAMTLHYLRAVEGMQVIQADRTSVVDALELNIGRLKRGNPRGRRHTGA